MYFRVAKVHTYAGGHSLTNAKGLFFLQDNFLYLITSRHVVSFCCDDILNRNEALLLILIFPLGFHDIMHNLPIVPRATITSSFPHPFKGESYLLTDARLHRGMSGSPVIARTHGGF
jgi:hypothetical protein